MGTTSARDASGNANTGWLINGTKKAIGKIGQALNFDGVDDYVGAGTGASLDPAGSLWTVSAWIKTLDSNGAIICKDISATTGCNTDFYILEVIAGEAQFEFSAGDAASTATANGTSVVNDNNWHNIVGVRSGLKTAELYVDGVRQSTNTHTGSLTGVGTTRTFEIGREDTINYLTGLIDEVRVYNRALSPDEIKRLYNMGR